MFKHVHYGHQNSKWWTRLSCQDPFCCAELEVALCGLTYNHRWYNISSAHKNNEVVNGEHVSKIRDGYYNVCELNEDVFEPLGAELYMHTPTGRLQMSSRKRLVLNRRLAKLIGFARDEFEPGKTYIADEPHRLAIHREICVHLAEISTSDNQHNGHPSTLLRSVPVENEKCGGGWRKHSLSCSTKDWNQVLSHSWLSWY